MLTLPYTIDTFPLKRNSVKGLLVILFIIILIILVFLLTNSLIFSICALLFILFDLKSFFFPTQFTIYEKRVDKKFLFREVSYPIEKFKRVINCKKGILLSPYKNRSTLREKFRGLYIICFDDDQKGELLTFFNEKIENSR